MTEKEAIGKIKEILEEATKTEDAVCYVTSVDAEPLNLAIKALEKQIPKKPKVLIDTWSCPTCAEKVEYQTMLGDNVLYHGCYDFCPNCGQRIDWSEEG